MVMEQRSDMTFAKTSISFRRRRSAHAPLFSSLGPMNSISLQELIAVGHTRAGGTGFFKVLSIISISSISDGGANGRQATCRRPKPWRARSAASSLRNG